MVIWPVLTGRSSKTISLGLWLWLWRVVCILVSLRGQDEVQFSQVLGKLQTRFNFYDWAHYDWAHYDWVHYDWLSALWLGALWLSVLWLSALWLTEHTMTEHTLRVIVKTWVQGAIGGKSWSWCTVNKWTRPLFSSALDRQHPCLWIYR